MSRCYKNAPILEALCEFRFASDPKWDYTIPGLMYDRVKSQFPERRQENLVAVEFESEEKGLKQRVKAPGIKMQFRRMDGSALLQVAPHLLAVNQLKPYPTWPQFKSITLEAYATYLEIAHPAGIERIGLRYINQIYLPEKRMEIDRVLKVLPSFPKGYPGKHGNLLMRAEFPFEAEQELLILVLASGSQSGADDLNFILDIDYAIPKTSETGQSNIGESLERAHSRIEGVFEASITDEARGLFGE